MFQGLTDKFSKLLNKIFWWQTIDPVPIIPSDFKIDKSLNTLLVTNFFEITKNKEEFIDEINELKDFYFAQLIVDRIIDDALNISANDEELFIVKVVNERGEHDESISEMVNDFLKEINFQKILIDVAADLLYYGEYALRIKKGNGEIKGIVNIIDDVDLTRIIPVYRDSEIAYYLTIEDKKLINTPPGDYAFFILPGNRIKIKIDGLDNKVAYLRMGKSILYPVFGLLKELKFLENLIPSLFIKNMIKTKIVGIQVPPGTKPEKALEITRTYQKMINKNLNNQIDTSNLDNLIAELTQKAGAVKIIPTWDDRGQLQAQDFGNDTDFNDLQDKVNDLRKLILSTVGIPGNLIEDAPQTKGDLIKQHIRYTKKLKNLQLALAHGIEQLVLIHLNNLGFNYNTRNIQVIFKNIINQDDLEKLEFLDIQVSMFDNFISFIDNFDGKENIKVNTKNYIKFINNQFENITGFTLFEYEENSKGNENEI